MRLQHQWLVVDVEATCCEAGEFPRDEMEVIEIGAVVVDPAAGWKIVDEFASFVRPVSRPRLTSFCRTLTGIRQYSVDAAQEFAQVYADFAALVGCPGGTWASWGRFDRDILAAECERHGCDLGPLGAKHVDVARQFTRQYGRRRGHRWAMSYLGVPPEGRHHRGLDDARNVARMIQKLIDGVSRGVA